jgi:hypothetical protein
VSCRKKESEKKEKAKEKGSQEKQWGKKGNGSRYVPNHKQQTFPMTSLSLSLSFHSFSQSVVQLAMIIITNFHIPAKSFKQRLPRSSRPVPSRVVFANTSSASARVHKCHEK